MCEGSCYWNRVFTGWFVYDAPFANSRILRISNTQDLGGGCSMQPNSYNYFLTIGCYMFLLLFKSMFTGRDLPEINDCLMIITAKRISDNRCCVCFRHRFYVDAAVRSDNENRPEAKSASRGVFSAGTYMPYGEQFVQQPLCYWRITPKDLV